MTIFFVSHSAQAILQLCDRAILIDKGEVILEGQPKMVISYYQKYINATSLDRIDIRNAILEKYRRAELTKVDGIGSDDVISPENNKSSSDFLDILPIEEFFDETLISKSTVSHICHGAKIKNIQLTKLNGEKVNVLVMGKTYRISYDVEFSQAVQNVGFGIGFTNPSGLLIAGANCDATRLDFVAAGKTIKANFEFNCHFLSGHYFLTCHVRGVDKNGEEEITLHRIIDGLIFKVGFYGPMLSTGIFDLSIQVDIGSEDNG